MPDNLLYFPYINLPQNDWTMHSLIYYDSVSSIVPDEYFYNPRRYESFMAELVRENLVIPLNPIEKLSDPFSLVDPFINFVSRPSYRIDQKRERFNPNPNNVRINRRKFGIEGVNGQKFNNELLYRLEQMGLARRNFGNWYDVETVTAGYLMSYLSNILAHKLDLLPATDQKFFPNYRAYHKQLIGHEEEQRRRAALQGVMPLLVDLDLRKLCRIKEKFSSEIRYLRNSIEQIAMDPRYNDETLLNLKIEELNFRKEHFSAKLNESRIGNVIFGTVMGLAGAVYGYVN